SDRPVSVTVQRAIKRSLSSLIYWPTNIDIIRLGPSASITQSNSKPMLTLPCRRTIDKIFNEMYDGKSASVKVAVKNSTDILLTFDF
ncbi:LOW QUALITY PROTEIN: hypothetical protein HZS_5873, partial [Henneguya salminicola]